MNQKAAWATFAGGLVTFLGTTSEILSRHTTWSEFTTPAGVAHLLLIGASFVVMLGGAIGIQLPRGDGAHGDRATDPK